MGSALAGSNVPTGETLLTGTVVPTTEGNYGDFYLRTDTWTLFGPKGDITQGVASWDFF